MTAEFCSTVRGHYRHLYIHGIYIAPEEEQEWPSEGCMDVAVAVAANMMDSALEGPSMPSTTIF